MYGDISYSYDNLNCALKTDICEVFNDIVEDTVMNIMLGKEISNEQLLSLSDNLASFGDEFNVTEAKALSEKIKTSFIQPS